MPSSLDDFLGSPSPSGRTHSAYASSILLPVAPEYSTGEVLLASAYRRLISGDTDAAVNLEDIDGLPDRLAKQAVAIDPRMDSESFRQAWTDLILAPGGLASPTPRGAQGSRRLKQLMPLVPELSRVAGVLGKVRNRWQPGNLLVSTLYSGQPGPEGTKLLFSLRDALAVTDNDDYFARFIENCLKKVDEVAVGRKKAEAPTDDELKDLQMLYPPAWRVRPPRGYLPSERFADDLVFVIGLKPRLTRRQWAVLVESLFRLGMGMHQLWLCRLNARVWSLCLDAVEDRPPSLEAVTEACWASQDSDEPMIQLAENAMPRVRRYLAEFGSARIGINLLLYVLQDAGYPWAPKLGATSDQWNSPAASIHGFLAHVNSHRSEVKDLLKQKGWSSLGTAAAAVADTDLRLLRGAATRNLSFFVRYSLGQIQPTDDAQRQYDQGYLLHREDKRGDRLQVKPAPSMLMLLVHCCCRSGGAAPASVEHFRAHLRAYGIEASADELRAGNTARDLEHLGLVVDSPDAGGGRLLVDPFLVSET